MTLKAEVERILDRAWKDRRSQYLLPAYPVPSLRRIFYNYPLRRALKFSVNKHGRCFVS